MDKNKIWLETIGLTFCITFAAIFSASVLWALIIPTLIVLYMLIK